MVVASLSLGENDSNQVRIGYWATGGGSGSQQPPTTTRQMLQANNNRLLGLLLCPGKLSRWVENGLPYLSQECFGQTTKLQKP